MRSRRPAPGLPRSMVSMAGSLLALSSSLSQSSGHSCLPEDSDSDQNVQSSTLSLLVLNLLLLVITDEAHGLPKHPCCLQADWNLICREGGAPQSPSSVSRTLRGSSAPSSKLLLVSAQLPADRSVYLSPRLAPKLLGNCTL